MKRLLISGTSSGCGKTTVTCALLTALKARGLEPTAFKCGPDYIDPMFHRAASGVRAYNLDPFFLDGGGLRSHLTAHAGEFSVIEGAMGYYDGIGSSSDASAYTVASETQTPVVLTVNARSSGHSLAAVIEGFARHRPDSRIEGVIFNDANESRCPDLEKTALSAGVKAFGTMPRNERWTVQSRHLGLMTAGEIEDLQDKLSELGRQAERTLDIDGLIALAASAPDLPAAAKPQSCQAPRVRIAVARDDAFCFIYEENLELLHNMGCELVFFSPLSDASLPPNVNGLYLCGGYPELYAEKLSGNKSMLDSIRLAAEHGMPTIAECGGFMYLHETLGGVEMCAVIRGESFATSMLQRFGYVTLTAGRSNLLCKAGDSIRAHEFHYWDSTNCGDAFTACKPQSHRNWMCVHATETLYAGFPHLYFPANPGFAENYVTAAEKYRVNLNLRSK